MLYLYAIAADAPSRLGRGLAGEPLRLLRLDASGTLSAIVGEPGAAPPLVPKAIRAHDAAVRRLLRDCPALLPARFGSALADDAEIRSRLAPRFSELATALGLVRGCVQMTLRVFGTPSPKAPAAGKALLSRAKVDSGTRYLLERAAEWRAAESMPEIEPLRLRLAGLVRAERIERHQERGLIGTAQHLVDRSCLTAYRARVRGAAAVLRPVRVHLSGPWAAYAFAPGLGS